jgi:hypothetical protein
MSETLLTSSVLSAPQASQFEELFSASERDLESASKAAAELRKHVAAAHKAASAGDVRALSRALQAARSVHAELDSTLDRAGDVLTHDLAKALSDGAFAAEIERQAKADGLRGVRSVHGSIMSFPVVIPMAASDFSLKIAGKKWTALRPSAIVAQLAKLRKRRVKTMSVKFIDAVERAYTRVTGGAYERAARIEQIHQELTPLPGQSAEYTILDFVNDLYLVERSRQLETSSQRILSFAASTSAKGGKAIRISTEEGEERIYSSIRFD